MEKEFNVTGTCIPSLHYMVDTTSKLEKVIKFIDKGKYFIINTPRQYGKTTTLFLLENELNELGEYLTISISFEGIRDSIFEKEELFVKAFVEILEDSLSLKYEALAAFLKESSKDVMTFLDLSIVLTKFILISEKKVVLMIDEADKSSNNQVFLSFLGMLRNKYLVRNEGKNCTFHSIILASVHDVKTIKLKIRPDEEEKYNTPWNIASDFDVDMSFSEEEIRTMLDDYTENKGVELDREYFSEKLYYYTSGYPFLVSKLCKIIDEKIMPEGSLTWDKEYMDLAVKEILRYSNTNFDSLIKNIENNEELKHMVKSIIINGNIITYNHFNPTINLGMIYGIFKNEDMYLKVNNRIYEQLLYNKRVWCNSENTWSNIS